MFSTYYDGIWGILIVFLLLFPDFSNNLKPQLNKDFFFSTVRPLRNSRFMQGKIYFLQLVSFTGEVKMVHLVLHSYVRIVTATLSGAEALHSLLKPQELTLFGELARTFTKEAVVKISVVQTMRALRMQWSPSTIRG